MTRKKNANGREEALVLSIFGQKFDWISLSISTFDCIISCIL